MGLAHACKSKGLVQKIAYKYVIGKGDRKIKKCDSSAGLGSGSDLK